jgi:hypothetical protein
VNTNSIFISEMSSMSADNNDRLLSALD